MVENFNTQPELIGTHVRLRPLMADDFEPLFSAANDPEIWAGHPVKTRYQRDVFQSYFNMLLERGGTLAIIDVASDTLIGCSRYYVASDRPDSISIGFTFLNNAYWGGATNFHVKRLMNAHVFETFSELWFHIDPTNLRSQKATAKLGAVHDYDAMLDLSGSGAVAWKCYRLTKAAWEKTCAARPS